MRSATAIILLHFVVAENSASNQNKTENQFVDKFDSILDKLFDEKSMFPDLKEGSPGEDKESKELVDKLMGKLLGGFGEKNDQVAGKGSADGQKGQGLGQLGSNDFINKYIEKLFDKNLKADPSSADGKPGANDKLGLGLGDDASTKELVDSMMKLFQPPKGEASKDGQPADRQKGLDESKKWLTI